MDRITRTETLQVLRSMRVEIPEDTKLSDENLEKRLCDALNAAQQKERLSSPLDFDALAPWPVPREGVADSNAKSVLAAVTRGNLAEAAMNHARNSRTPELYIDPFIDLRQTVMSIANLIDQGIKWCIVQDNQREQWAINLRFASILEVDKRTPAIVVLYRAFERSTALEGMRWVHAQSETNSAPSRRGVLLDIKATPLEQKLLMMLLTLNRRLVPTNFKVDRHATESNYEVSVLLPLGPLDLAAMTKLSHNLGCAVCGERATSRCAQCQSVSYCGAACQRANWPQHKLDCRQLKGGRWHTLPVHNGLQGMDNIYMTTVNRFHNDFDAASRARKIDPNVVPPNVWGDRVFIVKLQVGVVPGQYPYMMIYDRKRSFEVFLRSEEDVELFATFVGEMRGERGGHGGIKMYRWARRTGDWELSVCLDRVPPPTDTNW
ncbi:hypothetical protein OH76DRAFT_1413095 [Lentinus brumalis]|uniref:MYND-type domain-containing protein n=1 Tax=Lentinus brumalis TaxID=2498619 RepID=A0A371CIZ3_9APHY|nr:hypothetical protein OH76DRAFT_1413095 [Polyporus brumalis]